MNELTPEELRELVGILDEQLISLQTQVREYLVMRDKWFNGNYPNDWKGIVRQNYDDATKALRKAIE